MGQAKARSRMVLGTMIWSKDFLNLREWHGQIHGWIEERHNWKQKAPYCNFSKFKDCRPNPHTHGKKEKPVMQLSLKRYGALQQPKTSLPLAWCWHLRICEWGSNFVKALSLGTRSYRWKPDFRTSAPNVLFSIFSHFLSSKLQEPYKTHLNKRPSPPQSTPQPLRI